MYNFTNSPFEKMMKQRPHHCREEKKQPPKGSPCRGCSFWREMACLGFCYRNLKLPSKEDKTTSGQVDPKSP